ncbi:hypothetical protein, partial [Polaromonas sp.]
MGRNGCLAAPAASERKACPDASVSAWIP